MSSIMLQLRNVPFFYSYMEVSILGMQFAFNYLNKRQKHKCIHLIMVKCQLLARIVC